MSDARFSNLEKVTRALRLIGLNILSLGYGTSNVPLSPIGTLRKMSGR
jgi:hypothetical protein